MKKDIAIDIVSKTGLKTWPQIFIDDSFIGGYTELKQYFERKVYE
jgi:glutaredoxin